MELNLRDTPLRRFSTFWWALGLFVVFAIAIYIIKSFIYGDISDVDTARGKERMIKLENNKQAQSEALKSDPAELFSKAGDVLNFAPSDSGQPHNKELK